jgi:hypothetical protein
MFDLYPNDRPAMRIPQELIDRIVLINGWWFARYSTVCSNYVLDMQSKYVKSRNIRSAIRHRTMIGFDLQGLYTEDVLCLIKAYRKNKEIVTAIMFQYNVEYVDLETIAYEYDIVTFFDDIDIGKCIEHEAYVTFDECVRRSNVISRTDMLSITKMKHPLPFVQSLCNVGVTFDDELVSSLIECRQIASIHYIAYRKCFDSKSADRHPIFEDLEKIDEHYNMWHRCDDLTFMKMIAPTSWDMYKFVFHPNSSNTIIGFQHHPRLLAKFCSDVKSLDIGSVDHSEWTIWLKNVLGKLYRIAHNKSMHCYKNEMIPFYGPKKGNADLLPEELSDRQIRIHSKPGIDYRNAWPNWHAHEEEFSHIRFSYFGTDMIDIKSFTMFEYGTSLKYPITDTILVRIQSHI